MEIRFIACIYPTKEEFGRAINIVDCKNRSHQFSFTTQLSSLEIASILVNLGYYHVNNYHRDNKMSNELVRMHENDEVLTRDQIIPRIEKFLAGNTICQ